MMINWLAMYFYEGNNMDKVFVSPNRDMYKGKIYLHEQMLISNLLE